MTLFRGEDFHIKIPSTEFEVRFQNRSAPRSGDVILMQNGTALSSRAKMNIFLSHLVIDAVEEGDEGIYTIKNPDNADDVTRISLIVRGTGRFDCFYLLITVNCIFSMIHDDLDVKQSIVHASVLNQ